MENKRVGIVLAGGSGSRLWTVTLPISKQLLPVFDKPMIYYPLSVLMLAGIKDILIISTPTDLPAFKKLLKDGSQLGISLKYIEQPRPEGIAQAFIIGEDFIGKDSVSLVLGDNIFYGNGLSHMLREANIRDQITVFGYVVNDPERYGVVELDPMGQPIAIEEKPKMPRSNVAVTGLYFYDNSVINIAKNLAPSARGELEITDVNKEYLRRKKLHIEVLGRGYAWLDTGTHETLLGASNFVETIETRQGMKIACLEEIAFKKKWITRSQLEDLADLYNNSYGTYLRKL